MGREKNWPGIQIRRIDFLQAVKGRERERGERGRERERERE
jgi:hypothetical protein